MVSRFRGLIEIGATQAFRLAHAPHTLLNTREHLSKPLDQYVKGWT